jgi:hypothetical protein
MATATRHGLRRVSRTALRLMLERRRFRFRYLLPVPTLYGMAPALPVRSYRPALQPLR